MIEYANACWASFWRWFLASNLRWTLHPLFKSETLIRYCCRSPPLPSSNISNGMIIIAKWWRWFEQFFFYYFIFLSIQPRTIDKIKMCFVMIESKKKFQNLSFIKLLSFFLALFLIQSLDYFLETSSLNS